MDNYHVKLMKRALEDLEHIYNYIAENLSEKEIALALIKRIEEQIYSLSHLPYRCPERKIGNYKNRGYRQLIIENYIVIYKVEESQKLVVIVTVRYSPSHF